VRTPDRVIQPKVDAAPFAAVVDILRGGPGRVAVRRPDGELVYWFDWVDQALRTPDGVLRLRLTDGRAVDGSGALVWTWDSLYLRRPDGDIELEVGAERVDGGVPPLTAALWGSSDVAWRTVVGPFDGVPELEVRHSAVCDRNGTPIVEFDDEIPLPVAVWVARDVRGGI
jgi:hypothetical protein